MKKAQLGPHQPERHNDREQEVLLAHAYVRQPAALGFANPDDLPLRRCHLDLAKQLSSQQQCQHQKHLPNLSEASWVPARVLCI